MKWITSLINQNIIKGIILVEWKLGTIVNYYKGKGDALLRGNYRRLKLTDHIFQILKRIIKKLIEQKVNINKFQFGFLPGHGIKNAIPILRQLQEKYLSIKDLYFAFA